MRTSSVALLFMLLAFWFSLVLCNGMEVVVCVCAATSIAITCIDVARQHQSVVGYITGVLVIGVNLTLVCVVLL